MTGFFTLGTFLLSGDATLRFSGVLGVFGVFGVFGDSTGEREHRERGVLDRLSGFVPNDFGAEVDILDFETDREPSDLLHEPVPVESVDDEAGEGSMLEVSLVEVVWVTLRGADSSGSGLGMD